MAPGWCAAYGALSPCVRDEVPRDALMVQADGWTAAAWGRDAGIATPGAAGGLASAWVGDAEAGSRCELMPDGRAALQSDPFGLHAACWAASDGGIAAGSHTARVAAIAGLPACLEPEAVASYLCSSCVPAPLTGHGGVRRVPAGSCLTLDGGCVACERPWQWEEAPPVGDQARATEELRDLLRAAVRRRLLPDARPAVFLSGGLDSSTVATLLAQEGAQPLLLTLDFGPPHHTELSFAWMVADRLGLALHVVPCRAVDVRRAVESAARAVEAPFGDPATVPLWVLCEAAARLGATDVFTGDGGDQIFGASACRLLAAADARVGGDRGRDEGVLAELAGLQGRLDEMLTAAARERLAGWDAAAWLRPLLTGSGYESQLHRLRAASLAAQCAQGVAPRVRMLAEAHGLTARCPFLDRALARWSFDLPGAWIVGGACEKLLLRRAVDPWLPHEVVWREHRGMGAPVTEWCRGVLRSDVRRRLNPRRLRADGWICPEFVRAVERGEDAHGAHGSRSTGEDLWLLWFLQAWRDARRSPVAMPL